MADPLRWLNWRKAVGLSSGTPGNVMVMGVMVISLLTMFGVVMTSRMVIDANITGKRINATRAFYMAESGVQWARRYLVLNTPGSSVSLGTMTLPGGSVSVQIQRTTIYYLGYLNTDEKMVYQIVATASSGEATRQIEEYRRRGTWTPVKKFEFWREAVVDENY